MRRAAAYLAGLQAARRPLVRRADRRHHARIRLHPVPALAVSAARTASGIRRLAPLIDKAVRSILERQLPDGGFNIYVGRAGGSQRLGQGVFRAEAGRACRWTIRAWRALRERILALGGIQAANSYVKDQPQPVRSLSARSIAPAFRPKWCCCRSTSSTRCRRGRAPSWFRSPSCMPPTRARRCRPASTWTRSGCPAPARDFRKDRQLAHLAQRFPARRQVAEMVGAARLQVSAPQGHREGRASGCSSACTIPTAWARSIRP